MEKTEVLKFAKTNSNKELIFLIVFLLLIIAGMIGFGYYQYSDFNHKYAELVKKVDNISASKDTNTNIENSSDTNSSGISIEGNSDLVSDFKLSSEDIVSGYGTAYVTGYADVVNISYAHVGNGSYDYLYFHILNDGNSDFLKFVNSHYENQFVKKDAIGLGCVEKNRLVYLNSSDKYGRFTSFKLSLDDSNKIINSSKTSPIKLKLQRLKNSRKSGEGAENCFSFITLIDIVE